MRPPNLPTGVLGQLHTEVKVGMGQGQLRERRAKDQDAAVVKYFVALQDPSGGNLLG